MNDQIKSLTISFAEKLGATEIEVDIDETNDVKKISIRTPNDYPLVGKEESHLESFLHILKRMVLKIIGEDKKVNVDINNRNLRHDETLKTKAKIIAERAREFKRDVEMEPMSSYERMIVHSALEGHSNIKTESIGEGKNRRIIIKYSEEAKETF